MAATPAPVLTDKLQRLLEELREAVIRAERDRPNASAQRSQTERARG